MKSAVIVFPGSNCDRDMARAIHAVTGQAPAYLQAQLANYQAALARLTG